MSKTEIVTLVRQKPDHAAGLFDPLSDPEIYEFLDETPPENVAEVRARIIQLKNGPADAGEQWLNWCIFVGERIVGTTQATVYADDSAEIAYVLAKPHWHRGIGFQASQIMIAELINSHGVKRLLADTERGNSRSQRLLERLGFVEINRDGNDLFYELFQSA